MVVVKAGWHQEFEFRHLSQCSNGDHSRCGSDPSRFIQLGNGTEERVSFNLPRMYAQQRLGRTNEKRDQNAEQVSFDDVQERECRCSRLDAIDGEATAKRAASQRWQGRSRTSLERETRATGRQRERYLLWILPSPKSEGPCMESLRGLECSGSSGSSQIPGRWPITFGSRHDASGHRPPRACSPILSLFSPPSGVSQECSKSYGRRKDIPQAQLHMLHRSRTIVANFDKPCIKVACLPESARVRGFD